MSQGLDQPWLNDSQIISILDGCSAFDRDVYRVVSTIPAGETQSYAWVATHIGRPGAARAVGQALRRNPLPIVIPCHRVVHSDRSLGGFALGSSVKAKLLETERRLTRPGTASYTDS